MANRIPSHQLAGGLYVSGRPNHPKDRPPTMSARAAPYTGGDVKNSGDLGRMFVVPPTANAPAKAPVQRPPATTSSSSSGPIRSGSGPIPLPPTGLITSGPIRSGQLDAAGGGGVKPSASFSYGGGGGEITHAVGEVRFRFSFSWLVFWVVLGVLGVGFGVGGFMMGTVKQPVVIIAAGGVLVLLLVLVVWNWGWGRQGLLRYLRRYPDSELRGAREGQFIKVTGVVTCGSIPLESSFQKISRCIYVWTELEEYRAFSGKPANKNHRRFTWGSRHTERHVADFYISDFQSGLRAVVKGGHGAEVSTYVKPATVVDVAGGNTEMSPRFLHWLAEHNLSSDDRVMRLKEGYIKEGSTLSVLGVVQRHENVLMIVPPQEPISIGCQWTTCLLPTRLEGLILVCDETQNGDVMPV